MIDDFDIDVPNDDRWHQVQLTIHDGEVQGVEVDGQIQFATNEYLRGTPNDDDIDVGRPASLG